MTNSYVLDTSVLLSLGKRVFASFKSGDTLILPMAVINELESKRHDTELGITSRSVLRYLEELRSEGNLRTGVKLPGGAVVNVELNHIDTSEIPETVRREGGNDIRILAVAKSTGSTLVSRDLPLRLKADIIGVKAIDVNFANVPEEKTDSIIRLSISNEEMDAFHSDGVLPIKDDLYANQNIILTSPDGGSGLAVATSQWRVRKVQEEAAGKILGRSAEQRFALTHLLNDSVPVVALGGVAGGGKSLLAIAAGIDKVKKGDLKKVTVFKPAFSVQGGDLGFLPGTEDEKFAGFAESIFDALEETLQRREVEEMIRKGQLEILPLSHIRGRTLNSAYIVLDEAQSLELPTILSVLTRAGKNSQIAISYDLSQNDNLHISKHQGIHEAVQRMVGNPLFAHVNITKSERSRVAQMASDLLEDYIL